MSSGFKVDIIKEGNGEWLSEINKEENTFVVIRSKTKSRSTC
jgi:hypothetical protein